MLFLALTLLAGLTSINCNKTPLNLIRVCQGDTTSLTCTPGSVLQIYSARYGRFVSGETACPHESLHTYAAYDCISDVTDYIERHCDNKQQCSVKATSRNLGNPAGCKKVFKHLDIQFYCDQSPAPTTEPTSSPPAASTPDQKAHKQQLSREVMKCTKLYTTILDSAPHKECDALQAYKDCLLNVEVIDPASSADIERVMPTLNTNLKTCYNEIRQPTVMICKHAKLKGDCKNITAATPDLGNFDNAVKSIKVFYGNWALYKESNYRGTEDRVKPGFWSDWLGIYAPQEGEPITLFSNELSSLKPVDEIDEAYYDFTDTTFAPTSDYNTDIASTAEFSGASYSYSEPANKPVTTPTVDRTEVGYSQWINLDDISSSKHPDMCRSTYCLLGIRVIFDQIRSVTLPTRQSVEDIILNRLLNTYKIYPEQLVLAEIVKRSSEVILEIIDMKNAPKRVIDIAIEIEEDIKHEEFTFTLGDMMIVPSVDRYGVMLKTISEEYLPKRIQIQTDQPETLPITPDSPEMHTSAGNNVETEEPFFTPENFDNGLEDEVEKAIDSLEQSSPLGNHFYALLIIAVILFGVSVVAIATILYCRIVRQKAADYTLIKKVPSNIYVDLDVNPKKVEGFENPSYLLEEVEHM